MSLIIQIENLSKSYWRDSMEIPVLHNLNLEVERGGFLSLCKPEVTSILFPNRFPVEIDNGSTISLLTK